MLNVKKLPQLIKYLLVVCISLLTIYILLLLSGYNEQMKNYIQTKARIEQMREQEEYFTLTENHVAVFRKMIVVWDPSESGAPVVDIYYPDNFYQEVARELNIELSDKDVEENSEVFQQFAQEIGNSFEILLSFGTLKDGKYSYKNPYFGLDFAVDELPADSYSGRTIPIPQQEYIEFYFSEDHAKLLKNANAGWLHYWQLPGINSKRPYGISTFFEVDMAELLDMPYEKNEEGIAQLSPAQLQKLRALHGEMLYALQVYLEYADVDLGVYYRKPAGYGVWVKEKSSSG